MIYTLSLHDALPIYEEEYFAHRVPEIAELAGAARKRAIAALKKLDPLAFQHYEAERRRFDATNEFVRASGRFDLTARGKINTYALFAEMFAKLMSGRGRAGVIVPTGVATDFSNRVFFSSIIQDRKLSSFIAFDNQKRIFPAVHPDTPFALLTMSRSAGDPEFAAYLLEAQHLNDRERRYMLSAKDIARINPNTNTAPMFRSRTDAELAGKIYSSVPVLILPEAGRNGNPWGIQFRQGLFNMTSDSASFRTAEQLSEAGFLNEGGDWLKPSEFVLGEVGVERPPNKYDSNGKSEEFTAHHYVPLMEAKMIHQFDHRWATHDKHNTRELTLFERTDNNFEPTPRYWVPKSEVDQRLASAAWDRRWLIGWRDITNATNERTVIATAFPRAGVGNNLPFMVFDPDVPVTKLAGLLGNLGSLTCDFVARHKVGGTHLNFFIYQQLAILPPCAYSATERAFIVPRVVELTYTSHSMAPFARDLGYHGASFKWDEDRRAHLRAELDAFYARAYGLTRDELCYILDPADVKGADYPSETFRVLRTNEIRRYGEYRTARLVLAAY